MSDPDVFTELVSSLGLGVRPRVVRPALVPPDVVVVPDEFYDACRATEGMLASLLLGARRKETGDA